MGSFLRKLAEHAIPLGVVVFLMAGSAVAGGLVTGAEIQNDSITGKDVKDKSLTPKDFKGSVAGAKGDTGSPGTPGAPGTPGVPGTPGTVGTVGGTEIVQKSVAASTETPKELAVECPNGPVLSGGYVLHVPSNFAEQKHLSAVRSYAISNKAWLVRALDDTAALSWELSVIVVCST